MAIINKDQAIRVQVTDPCMSDDAPKTWEYVASLMPTKTGLLGKIVGTNYNVFRPWGTSVWYTNCTSSTRFNIETEGMTQDEIAIFMKGRR